jgi:ectoine hydroxylase
MQTHVKTQPDVHLVQLTRKHLDSYEKSGFLLLRDWFTPAEIAILMAETAVVFAEDTPRKILETSGAVRSIFAPHLTNEVFRRLSRLPRIIGPAIQILKSDVYIHQFKINAKVALEGDRWEWHQDFLYWHKEDSMPMPRVVTAVVFLQDVNDFNGPILVIPGSHEEGMIDTKSEHETHRDQQQTASWMSTLTADLKYKIDRATLARLVAKAEIFPIRGPAGSVLFFHGNLLHASTNNLSPWDRTCVLISYNSVENCLGEVENPRPDFIAHRNFSPLKPVSDSALFEIQ